MPEQVSTSGIQEEEVSHELLYCNHVDCDGNCRMNNVFKTIENNVLRSSDYYKVKEADREQDFLAGFLKTRRTGVASDFFHSEVLDISDLLDHLKVSTTRSSVMLQFVFLTVMKKFQNSRDTQRLLYRLEECGRHFVEPRDYIFTILKNPRYGFRSLLFQTLILIENNINNLHFLRNQSYKLQEYLENRADEIQRNNEHLGPLYDFMSQEERRQLANKSSFLLRVYRLYLIKVDFFLVVNDKIISENLSKLQKMRELHFAVVQNWDDMTRIPMHAHPRYFEHVMMKS